MSEDVQYTPQPTKSSKTEESQSEQNGTQSPSTSQCPPEVSTALGLLQRDIDEYVCEAIDGVRTWLNQNGIEVDLEYYETEQSARGAIKIGDYVLDISYQVTVEKL